VTSLGYTANQGLGLAAVEILGSYAERGDLDGGCQGPTYGSYSAPVNLGSGG